MHGELRRQCRIAAGRTPEPSATIIDSRSVKAAGTVGKHSRRDRRQAHPPVRT
jgi:putative transposase